VFTGLVQDLGRVAAVEATGDGARLTIGTTLAGELADGDSIAVNGVCLTATSRADGVFTADAMNETLARSSLGSLQPGAAVNLELAMRAGDRLGGHIVQGHVDGVGTIAAIGQDGFSRQLTVTTAPDLLRYVVEKGSITVEGVSLTVVAPDSSGYSVALIPHTLAVTTLGGLAPRMPVNLELDVLGKYVLRYLETIGVPRAGT
jgi:riboflavin synthase